MKQLLEPLHNHNHEGIPTLEQSSYAKWQGSVKVCEAWTPPQETKTKQDVVSFEQIWHQTTMIINFKY